MIDFCNCVNAGSEPGLRLGGRYGRPRWFLLREPESEEPAVGFPEVPAHYTEYLLKQPVTTEIRRIISRKSEPNRWDLYEVEIDAGSEVGLLPQMTLEPWKEEAPFWVSTIIAVERGSSRVQIGDYTKTPQSEPRVGDKLSSKGHLFQAENDSGIEDATLKE